MPPAARRLELDYGIRRGVEVARRESCLPSTQLEKARAFALVGRGRRRSARESGNIPRHHIRLAFGEYKDAGGL